MKPNAEIYRGVPLTHGRTEQMIDAIIEKRGSMKTNEIARFLGLESFRPVNAVCRLLNTMNGTTAKAPKKPKTVIKEAKNTFKNYYGSGKEKARDLIANAIMDTKRQSSNILTLPAENWILEKNIIKKKAGYKFTAVERERDTFNQMIINLAKDIDLLGSVVTLHNKTIGEVVANDKEDTYSSAILDYCGFIDTFYDEINDMLKRNLVKRGGYITLTFSENDRVLNHSHHTTSHSNTYIKNCYMSKEEMTGENVTTGLVNFLVYSNNGYKVETKFTYRDKRVNMLLFIIKRIDE